MVDKVQTVFLAFSLRFYTHCTTFLILYQRRLLYLSMLAVVQSLPLTNHVKLFLWLIKESFSTCSLSANGNDLKKIIAGAVVSFKVLRHLPPVIYPPRYSNPSPYPYLNPSNQRLSDQGLAGLLPSFTLDRFRNINI